MNRWLVVAGAILIQLSLGAIYAWSVFTPSLRIDPFNFSATQTQAIFSVGLASFAFMTILAGRWQQKLGPQPVAMTGGIVLGLGYVLAKFVGGSFLGLLITIGFIGGAGIGLAYVVPIAVGVKWFPDQKGLVTGLAVAGFGFGALVWVKLAGSWGGLIASLGVSNVFLLYGLIFSASVLVGSFAMKLPPRDWLPSGYRLPVAASGAIGSVDLTPREMLRTREFYLLWLMFIFGAMAGLMVIGTIKLFGIEALKAGGMEETVASATAGTAMAVFYSMFNGFGRIAWGAISDRIGRKTALTVMMAIQGTVMLLFFQMGSSAALLYLGAALIGFNFGGNFALFPSATADLFGSRYIGANYGWVFCAYGLGGIIGPMLAGIVRDHTGNFLFAFVPAGLLCLLAACLGQFLQPVQSSQSNSRI
jgi:OFA family oxalate/formate antiporter-like MFS transporter